MNIFMLIFACNSFGMKNNPDQNINIQCESLSLSKEVCESLFLSKEVGEKIQVSQQDLMTLLTENNKLLHKIKRQNRAILKQNYLNFAHQKLLTERCSSKDNLLKAAYEKSVVQEYKLQTKIKETYASARYADHSWNSSDDDDIFYSK